MKNKINVGDLIMLWKDRPDKPHQQRLCYVVELLGPFEAGALLCPVGEELPTLPENKRVWSVKEISHWKVG